MEPTGRDRQKRVLDALADLEAEAARLLARRIDLLVELTAAAAATEQQTGREQFTTLELAGTCGLGQGRAQDLVTEAQHWTACLPETLALLRAGGLMAHQAQVLFRITEHCPEDVCRAVETAVLSQLAADPAGIAGVCPADLGRTARRVLLTVEAQQGPRVVAEREETARAGRRVWARPVEDGMGIAGALLPAEQLATWCRDLDILTRAEKTADRTAGIVRTAGQRRADLFAALPAMVLALRAGDLAGAAPGVSARPVGVLINVHVPMDTVLDLTSTPGRIEGFGPVSAEHVRRLLPTAALRRIAVDATSGRPVAIDTRTVPAITRTARTRRTTATQASVATAADRGTFTQARADGTGPAGTVAARSAAATRSELLAMITPVTVVDRAEPQHDPSAALARLVDLRDERCSGPGCSARAGLTDRDHNEPWPAGATAAWNLVVRYRRCHRAKHAGWTAEQHPDGSTTWTSPLGRTYTRPSPHQPPTPLPDDSALPPPRNEPPPVVVEPGPDDVDTWFDPAPVAKSVENCRRSAADDDPPPF